MLALLAMLAFGDQSWRFAAGASAGKMTPVMGTIGFGYKNAILYIEGMGTHKGDNDFWCGLRGGLDWTFFWKQPFSMDIGVGGGYAFAEAPNKLHQAINDANGGRILYPYNYVETLDVSAEVRVHLFGFFTQIDVPIHYFRKHDEPDILWRIGYLLEF